MLRTPPALVPSGRGSSDTPNLGQEGEELKRGTGGDPPPAGGAGVVLNAAVLARGMLRDMTRQPVPTVPVARGWLGRGGSAYRLTWGGTGDLGHPPCTAKQPSPWGQHAGGSEDGGHSWTPSVPQFPHLLSGAGGSEGDSTAILELFWLSPLPGAEGSPLLAGRGHSSPPVLLWALWQPHPRSLGWGG